MSESASLPTPDPHGDPMLGRVIADRYRLLGRLGEGGMGAVFRAEHILMKKVVALKLLHADLGNVEEAARRFEREAQSASRLNHPNIVAVTDFGRTAGGELFLVMEHIAGESLGAVIDRQGALPWRRAVAIAGQILQGLEHAHAAGVIHRDLKPANVMLCRYSDPGRGEVVKILDFGIAKMSAAEAGEPALTQGAMVFGTPSYMSPEQATAQEADARSDVYSSGVMLYEMLSGRKPFVADDLIKVMALQVTAAPPPFRADAAVPGALQAVVMQALEKDRDRRFPSATAFRQALEKVEGQGTRLRMQRLPALARQAATSVRRAESRLPWPVRRWVRPAALGTLVLVLALPLVCRRHPREGAGPTAAPPPPRPVEPALKAPLRRVEEAMARGQLAEARLLLMEQVSARPQNGRVRYLLGNLDFAEHDPAAALADYREALRLDPGLRADANLLLVVRGLVSDKRLGPEALEVMIQQIGRPAGAVLAGVASEERRPELRQEARAACQSLGCAGAVDLVRSYTLDLQQGKTCEERRAAVEALAATKDPRAVAPLKRARRLRGGLLGGILGGGNQCIRKDIEAALEALGGLMQLLRLIVVVVTTLAMAGSYLQEVRRLGIIRRLPGDQARAYYEATRQRDERVLIALAAVLALMAAAAIVYTFVVPR